MQFFIILFIVLMVLAYQVNKQNHIKNIFEDACEALSLTYDPGNFFQYSKIIGSKEGCQVVVKKTKRGKVDFLKFSCKQSVRIPGNISISKESMLSQVVRTFGIHDIETGVKYFDDKMKLAADSPHVLIALLDDDSRKEIFDLYKDVLDFKVSSHDFVAHIKPSMDLTAAKLTGIIKKMVSITNKLTPDLPIKERMIRNIESDLNPGFRAKNVLGLVTHFSKDKQTTSILSKAIKDTDIGVQLEAARHLGKKGLNHLLKLLKKREALLNTEQIPPILTLFKKKKFRESIPVLQTMISSPAVQRQEKVLILEAFKEFEDPNLSDLLIAQLEKNETEYRDYIIDALGSCGQVEAVEKLFKLGKSTINPLLRGSVREAITKIQSRLGDVDKGWLSVTELDEIDGALSIADQACDGSLSMVEIDQPATDEIKIKTSDTTPQKQDKVKEK